MISKLQPRVFLMIIATLFKPVTAQINLALHGTVAQQTTYTDAEGISYNANMAIEGPANNNWEDGCSSTGYQLMTWWGLFLPRLAYVTNVKSYYRKDGCWKGSWGTNCTNPCPLKCIDQHCYPGNGSCAWGCDPQNCFNNTCDIHTGACTEGCVDGWVGKYCNTNIQHK